MASFDRLRMSGLVELPLMVSLSNHRLRMSGLVELPLMVSLSNHRLRMSGLVELPLMVSLSNHRVTLRGSHRGNQLGLGARRLNPRKRLGQDGGTLWRGSATTRQLAGHVAAECGTDNYKL